MNFRIAENNKAYIYASLCLLVGRQGLEPRTKGL